MKRTLLTAAALTLVAGCATRPSAEDVADFTRRNTPPAATSQQAPIASTAPAAVTPALPHTTLIPPTEGMRIIIVGNVMALETFDQDVLQQRYDNYVKQMKDAGKTPQFSKDWYLSTTAGLTQVKFAGVTGVYHRFYRAEVPKDLVGSIAFSSAFGTAMVGSSGDLVAAQRNEKTGTWVTHLLCREKDPTYDGCKAQYKVGAFQGVDGKEIDDKLRVVSGGATIDVTTFRAK